MNILGVHCALNQFNHDPGAALISRGNLIAVCEEERFSRTKSSRAQFPYFSIQSVLREGGLTIRDIDILVTTGNTKKSILGRYIEQLFCHYFGSCPELRFVDHQDSHLASAFFYSKYSEAMCISTGFGLDEVPGINDIPTVFVNLLPLQHIPLYKFSLTHPKRLIWRETGDLLNIDEYMQHSYISSGEYEAAGIRIVDLTSEEINKTVMEMESVLRGERLLSDAQLHYQEQLIQSIFDLDKEKKEGINII